MGLDHAVTATTVPQVTRKGFSCCDHPTTQCIWCTDIGVDNTSIHIKWINLKTKFCVSVHLCEHWHGWNSEAGPCFLLCKRCLSQCSPQCTIGYPSMSFPLSRSGETGTVFFFLIYISSEVQNLYTNRFYPPSLQMTFLTLQSSFTCLYAKRHFLGSFTALHITDNLQIFAEHKNLTSTQKDNVRLSVGEDDKGY